ncbi:MAG TPA: tRNA (guanosine(46)-N7)-methyltransferase TrmB [Candidatus Akkermansia intestinigallinarum]|uniref:tRNA (guanine-N(7)-)-methyltransferase n=1 Tax=Candidatus Akkermansia intestinigallinarum TaxID=2838431 RepID=A0A9D2AHQ1_9BACT|nr:tRNA (guanosine(46)-N7)-methyltransferase TrmB [Candidatus Akkermansia intestinigallinarum]
MNSAYVPDDYFRRHRVSDIFGDGESCEVDLGCGDGGFLLAMAEHYPERRFLGIERLLGRVRKVCRDAQKRELDNLRVLRIESRYFLEWFIEPGSVSRLHYLFPDPWPKEKHHKNRLVQEDFIPVLHRALTVDGSFLFKTDHEGYFEWVCERMEASPLFKRVEWSAPFYPKTDFQQQWEAMGKPIYAAEFRRCELPNS